MYESVDSVIVSFCRSVSRSVHLCIGLGKYGNVIEEGKGCMVATVRSFVRPCKQEVNKD